MRRTTLHRTTVAAATAATLLLAGCGTQHDSGAGPGSAGTAPSASPSATPSAHASASAAPASSTPSAPSTPAKPAGCGDRAQLTAADSGRTVCLAVGGQLRLNLDGTKDRPWAPVKTAGTALRATNAGFVILPGDAVAAYDAVAPGTARLTSSRPQCATGTGQVACKSVRAWTVTVKVTAP